MTDMQCGRVLALGPQGSAGNGPGLGIRIGDENLAHAGGLQFSEYLN